MTHPFRDNVCLDCAVLAEGTNANTFKTTGAVSYVIGGRVYTKAATDNLAFSSGHTALAAKQTCAFFVWLDTSGNVTTTQSSIVPNSQGSGYAAGAWDWPNDSSKCCIGAIVISTNNSATFTPNSTDFAATDVVDTFHNVALSYGAPVQY